MKIKGILPALVTPLNGDETINVPVLNKLISDLIEQGADGFYIGGATGEGLALRTGERKVLAEAAIAAANKKIPCIIQVAATVFSDAIDLAKHAEKAGAAAISATAPLFFAYDEDDVYSYYKTLAASVHIPLMVYYSPAANFRSSADFARRLFEIDNVDTDYYTEHTNSVSVLRLSGSDPIIDTYVPIPNFIFKNIKHLSLSISKWYTNIEIYNSTIHFMYAYERRNGGNNIYNPIKIEDSKLQIATAASYPTTSSFNAPEALFINTTILPPLVSGSILNGDSGLARYLPLFSKTPDGKLKNINHAHLMTKLNKDFFASTTLQASEKYVLLNNLR